MTISFIMNKYHSFQLPKVKEEEPKQLIKQFNELQAQQSLFQISKNEENIQNHRDHFWRQLNKFNIKTKRYQKIQLPRRKNVEEVPQIEIKTYRHFNQNETHQILTLTNFVILESKRRNSNLSVLQGKKTENLFHEQVNRKAKYIFRSKSKNKKKLAQQYNKNKPSIFSESIYCRKMKSYENEY